MTVQLVVVQRPFSVAVLSLTYSVVLFIVSLPDLFDKILSEVWRKLMLIFPMSDIRKNTAFNKITYYTMYCRLSGVMLGR